MRIPQVPVAKEGYPFIFFAAFSTLIITLISCSWAAYLGLAITAFVLYFFRDPERFIADKEHIIVSPADGKIIAIEKVFDDDFLQERSYKISIFMNIFNVHVNRIPFSGRISQIHYSPGSFYSADSEKGALHNEKCATIVENDSGVRVAFVQVAGLIARRIVNWLEINDKVTKGQRFGLIRFGSRVDVFVPTEVALAVEKGMKVRAGETILCYLSL